MTAGKFIRYATLSSGIIFCLYLLSKNVSETRSFFGQLLVMIFYMMLPFYLYLIFTRKTTGLLKLIIPAAALITVYGILIREYLNSDPAVSGLAFLSIPIGGLIVVLISLGISYLFEKLLEPRN